MGVWRPAAHLTLQAAILEDEKEPAAQMKSGAGNRSGEVVS